MYAAERTAAYAQYQEALTKIALLTVRDLAQSCREVFPSAATIWLEDSDQGDFLRLHSLGGSRDEVLADAEEMESHGIESSTTAWNLSANCQETWAEYVTEQQGRYSLDIGNALTIDPARFATDTSAEMVRLLVVLHRAIEGDSNDAELEAYRDTLSEALTRWPEVDASSVHL